MKVEWVHYYSNLIHLCKKRRVSASFLLALFYGYLLIVGITLFENEPFWLFPSSRVIKPKLLSALNHLAVPIFICRSLLFQLKAKDYRHHFTISPFHHFTISPFHHLDAAIVAPLCKQNRRHNYIDVF